MFLIKSSDNDVKKCIQDFDKHLRWGILQQKLTTFKLNQCCEALRLDVCCRSKPIKKLLSLNDLFQLEMFKKHWKIVKKAAYIFFMS